MRSLLVAYYFVRFILVAATVGLLYYEDADAANNTNHYPVSVVANASHASVLSASE